MNNVVIRKAEESDHEEVMNLYGDFVENPERYKGLDNDSFKKFIEKLGSFLDLAVLDNQIVGFIAYSRRTVIRYSKDIVEVEELYVSPDHRKSGIGKKLLEHVLDYSKNESCEYVFVSSAKERVEAHKFYEALGFDQYGLHFRRRP
jgi:ribosomal protein S18 acetylase RimI-like enzyme